MKQIVYNLGLLALLGVGISVNAQENTGRVGINTEDNPQATLEVKPSSTNANGTTNEGIIAPQLSKDRVAKIATPVEGTLVYVVDEANKGGTIDSYTGKDTKVADITEKGYYFYNGAKWVRTSASNSVSNNIYTADGTLTDKRTVDQNGNDLVFTGGKVGIDTDSPAVNLSVMGVVGSGAFRNSSTRALYTGVTGGQSTIGQYVGFGVYKNQNDNNNFLSVGDNNDNIKQRFLIWNTNAGKVYFSPFLATSGTQEEEFSVADNAALTILHANKNVGIGVTNPTVKLDVNGSIKSNELVGDGERPVYADASGKLVIGTPVAPTPVETKSFKRNFRVDNTDNPTIAEDDFFVYLTKATEITLPTPDSNNQGRVLCLLSQDEDVEITPHPTAGRNQSLTGGVSSCYISTGKAWVGITGL